MSSAGGTPRTAVPRLGEVRDALRRGELLAAFDLAEQELADQPGDVALQYLAVLALARSGSTAEADRRFHQYGLATTDEEDVAALGAWIKKDMALGAEGDERRRLASEAAGAYRSIYDRTKGYYPAVNAASLALIAGDRTGAADLAAEALRRANRPAEDSYYARATQAEAHLLLGDISAARAALNRAAAAAAGDYGAVSTTRRQLRTVCGYAGIDIEVLGALAGPTVVHFCGHRIVPDGQPGRFRAADEADAARRIASAVACQPAAFAYGSLASGADILWAEALVATAELHVVLPFSADEFVARSIAPAGAEWTDRFHRCLGLATSVNYATVDAYRGNDVLYRYCAELAMGLALLRARYLDADVYQLALWDGQPAVGEAGTAIDVSTWQRSGHRVIVIHPLDHPVEEIPEPAGRSSYSGDPVTGRSDREHASCVVRAMLFADVRGFSKLTDEQIEQFGTHVLGAFARVLDHYDDAVEYRNTWGDSLYVVLSDPLAAAECALDLQEAMEGVDLEGASLPSHLALRLGGHVGPVFRVVDPILGTPSFIGSHINRTARIEPVTPPGAIYVSEPFAAALELAGGHALGCDYVGHMPAAKDYGRLRMYRLRRQQTAASQPATGEQPIAAARPAGSPGVGGDAGSPGVGGDAGSPGVGGDAGSPGVGGDAGSPGVGGDAGSPGVGGDAGSPGVGGDAGSPGVGGDAVSPRAGRGGGR